MFNSFLKEGMYARIFLLIIQKNDNLLYGGIANPAHCKYPLFRESAWTAMVLRNFQCRGRLVVGQESTVLAVGASGRYSDIFSPLLGRRLNID